jgi:hypothetical protein
MTTSISNRAVSRCIHLLTLIYDQSEWNSQNFYRNLVYIYLNSAHTGEVKCDITESAFLFGTLELKTRSAIVKHSTP